MLSSSLPLPYHWKFLLPLPAPFQNFCFRVRFRFQPVSSKYFRFHKKLTASASTSLFSMKQLIVSSVKKQASLLCKLFYLTCVVDWAWYGMEDDFSMFHNGSFLSFHFHSSLKIFHSMFHSILKFPSIFHSIVPYQRNFILKAMQRIL